MPKRYDISSYPTKFDPELEMPKTLRYRANEIIVARYRIIERLGIGNIGATYLVEDKSRKNERVVLKLVIGRSLQKHDSPRKFFQRISFSAPIEP